MASITGQALIQTILRTIGVLASGQTPSANDANDCLAIVNRMIDSWRIERLMIPVVQRVSHPLSVGVSSYSLGSGGDIAYARPNRLYQASYLSNGFEQPIPVLQTAKEWQELVPQKTLTGTLPQLVYYDPTFPLGTVYPWPILSAGTVSLILYLPIPLSGGLALATTYEFPPGYDVAIITNGAMASCPEFRKQLDPVLAQQAVDAKAAIKSANIIPLDMAVDAALLGRGYYNIYTGSYGPGSGY